MEDHFFNNVNRLYSIKSYNDSAKVSSDILTGKELRRKRRKEIKRNK